MLLHQEERYVYGKEGKHKIQHHMPHRKCARRLECALTTTKHYQVSGPCYQQVTAMLGCSSHHPGVAFQNGGVSLLCSRQTFPSLSDTGNGMTCHKANPQTNNAGQHEES
jgi:hypothetical protein